jgi:hypothetical protein
MVPDEIPDKLIGKVIDDVIVLRDKIQQNLLAIIADEFHAPPVHTGPAPTPVAVAAELATRPLADEPIDLYEDGEAPTKVSSSLAQLEGPVTPLPRDVGAGDVDQSIVMGGPDRGIAGVLGGDPFLAEGDEFPEGNLSAQAAAGDPAAPTSAAPAPLSPAIVVKQAPVEWKGQIHRIRDICIPYREDPDKVVKNLACQILALTSQLIDANDPAEIHTYESVRGMYDATTFMVSRLRTFTKQLGRHTDMRSLQRKLSEEVENILVRVSTFQMPDEAPLADPPPVPVKEATDGAG